MMMWTKSAINSVNSDPEDGPVHTIRQSTEREAAAAQASGATASANPRVLHIHDGTPEAIAYQLFLHIAEMEEMYLTVPPTKGKWPAHRPWILSTYAQCIKAVKEGRVD